MASSSFRLIPEASLAVTDFLGFGRLEGSSRLEAMYLGKDMASLASRPCHKRHLTSARILASGGSVESPT